MIRWKIIDIQLRFECEGVLILPPALMLWETDEHWIRKRMGVVGARIVQELRGVSCLALEDCPAPKQGITVSRMFGKPITSLADSYDFRVLSGPSVGDQVAVGLLIKQGESYWVSGYHGISQVGWVSGTTRP